MKVFLKDNLHPEDEAMLQALYSRSGASVEDHLKKLEAVGSGKFMETYYVGYGHKSIGDCGTTTLFIEDVSILADKVVQDNQLYNGQETSTRYIDMARRDLIDPVHTDASANILTRWMLFYSRHQTQVAAHVRQQFPRRPDEKEELYEKAVKARTFDILRGFLPAAITTQLSWHTNLRQAFDRLQTMRHVPLQEVRTLSHKIWSVLSEHYPHSFGIKPDPVGDVYRAETAKSYYFELSTEHDRFVTDELKFEAYNQIEDDDLVDEVAAILNNRPPKTELPSWLAQFGMVHFRFLLDYGSFRDIQRHRNGVCRMPLLTGRYGFHPWYLAQLPPVLEHEAKELFRAQSEATLALDCDKYTRQYYYPLGQRVLCQVSYGLPALLYVTELRTGKLVHPTLRQVMQQVASWIYHHLHVTLHADFGSDDWDVRRGQQDIIQR